MPYIPGNRIQGYCLGCKSDTSQTVIDVEGMQVRVSRCERCGNESDYRTPRVRTKARLREVAAARKAGAKDTAATPRRTRRKKEDPAAAFRKLVAAGDPAAARPYDVKNELAAGQMIEHSAFGLGVVTALTEEQKATVLFEDGPRVLVCNRG